MGNNKTEIGFRGKSPYNSNNKTNRCDPSAKGRLPPLEFATTIGIRYHYWNSLLLLELFNINYYNIKK
jgi:hypothetical protein